MAHDVFISYSSKDKNVAHAVCAALEQQHIRCWIASRDVTPGKEWGEEIVQAISSSRIMVLIFSSAANHSRQVLREVERAVNKNVVIIPFRIEDVLPTKSMEYFLSSTHWLDALTPDLENHIRRLVKTIGDLTHVPVQSAGLGRPVFAKTRNYRPFWYGIAGVAALLMLYGAVQLFHLRIQIQTGSPGIDRPPETRQLPANQDAAVPEQKPTAAATPPEISPNKPSGNTGNLEGEKTNPSLTNLKIGDYIRFGSYNGESVEWRVINVDVKGHPWLIATRIISIKPFDAAETGVYNQTASGRKLDDFISIPLTDLIKKYTQDELRQMKGSNDWASSNLREWLNSHDKRVKYSTQPPAAEAVANGDDSYNNEPGFLYDFSPRELKMMLPVTRKAVLSAPEQDRKEAGTGFYTFNEGKIRDAAANYEQVYSQSVSDKVFLLSVKEVADFIVDRGWDTRAIPTAHVQEKYNVRFKYYPWWLSTPEATTSFRVFFVNDDRDFISHYNAAEGKGVRPALVLTGPRLPLTGLGSETDPYGLK